MLFEPVCVRYLVWVICGWLLAAFLIVAGVQWDGLDTQVAVLLTCTVLGLVGGWAWGFHVRSYRQLMPDIRADRYRDVYRAITRGRVPEDRILRSAAIAVAQRYLNRALPGRRLGIGMSVLLIGACAFNARAMNWDGSAPNVSVAWLALAAFWVCEAVQEFRLPRIVKARLQLLTAADQPVKGKPA